MTDDQKSGIALIGGSLGGLLTMAIHPTGAAEATPIELQHLASASAVAHTLAMLSFLAVFLGAVGLTRRLSSFERPEARDRLAFMGVTIYGFACVALLLAAATSGFIVPNIMLHMVRDTGANAPQWRIVIDAVFQFNQAFSRIYSVGACGAILLWSASALHNGGRGRGVAIYGCIIAPLLVALIAVGRLRFNVHGMAVIVLAQAIWFVAVGMQLCRRGSSTTGG